MSTNFLLASFCVSRVNSRCNLQSLVHETAPANFYTLVDHCDGPLDLWVAVVPGPHGVDQFEGRAQRIAVGWPLRSEHQTSGVFIVILEHTQHHAQCVKQCCPMRHANAKAEKNALV